MSTVPGLGPGAWRTRLAGEFARYVVSGTSALVAHVALLTAQVEWFGVPAVVASGVGFVLASLLNYALQRAWVFRTPGAHRVQLTRYALITTATLGLNLALFWLAIEIVGIWYPLGQVLCTGVIFVLNFAINRHYTFRAGGDALEVGQTLGASPGGDSRPVGRR